MEVGLGDHELVIEDAWRALEGFQNSLVSVVTEYLSEQPLLKFGSALLGRDYSGAIVPHDEVDSDLLAFGPVEKSCLERGVTHSVEEKALIGLPVKEGW